MKDTDKEAAVRASLDDVLGDLFRAAVENPTELSTASYARIDAALDRRMMPHRHLAWALAEAERLKRQLKSGLRGHAPDAVEDVASARAPNLGEAQR
ncbi:hypothetical protein MKK75_01940 [Methylobacterium sp. J-030]|uniref:hypothetical protein n=1 Tax=Methylobacterium sp. J-030 TaxID=2836627 RepID=UPI001FBA28B3|nr:hypothetical protein [Methylobacterium sp. J-030]MCJ2067574.1 hypothetical protein [Methylobacterium sp. J-030]